jgi:predicted nucleic acid-binding protein
LGLTLLAQIPEGETVTVDTAPIIYFLADTQPHVDRFAQLFEAVEHGRNRIVISTITLSEVLVGPLRCGDEILAERYLRTLTGAKGWSILTLSVDIAMRAARIRTSYRLKLPDAIQLATALETNSYALVTHDRDFKSVHEIPILGC